MRILEKSWKAAAKAAKKLLFRVTNKSSRTLETAGNLPIAVARRHPKAIAATASSVVKLFHQGKLFCQERIMKKYKTEN